MEVSLHVALSGQLATEKRLATIADNIANLGTTGFRQGGIRFSELVSDGQKVKTSFVSPGVSTLSERQGDLDQTGNQLDFAINGNGWFMLETPAGEALTRDGRFEFDQEGTLTNLDGYPILDQSGSPLQINTNSGPLTADRSGILHQNGTVVGSIGVFKTDQVYETMRNGAVGVLPDAALTSPSDPNEYSVQQGFKEKSNVDAVSQLANLITVQRQFDQASSMIQASELSLGEAIRLLGSQ